MVIRYVVHTHIDNDLNVGKVIISNASTKIYKGSIAGYIESSTSVEYSYFTSEAETSKLNDRGTFSNITISSNSSTTESIALSNLNSRTPVAYWNKWLLNINNASIIFKLNNINKSFSFFIVCGFPPKPSQ